MYRMLTYVSLSCASQSYEGLREHDFNLQAWKPNFRDVQSKVKQLGHENGVAFDLGSCPILYTLVLLYSVLLVC